MGKSPKNVRYRVTTVDAAGLLLFAVVFDAISVIPIVNIILVPIAQLSLAILFYSAGINVFEKRRAVIFLLATVSEMIPGISILPAHTVETALIILSVRKEDEAKAQRANVQA